MQPAAVSGSNPSWASMAVALPPTGDLPGFKLPNSTIGCVTIQQAFGVTAICLPAA